MRDDLRFFLGLLILVAVVFGGVFAGVTIPPEMHENRVKELLEDKGYNPITVEHYGLTKDMYAKWVEDDKLCKADVYWEEDLDFVALQNTECVEPLQDKLE